MNRFGRLLFCSIPLLALLGEVRGQFHQMAPGASSWTPQQILHLAKWDLTLPVSDSSGEKEALWTIGGDTLSKGYTSNYFYAGNDGGVYICPRCALSESPSAHFNIHTPSRLSATVAIQQLPQGAPPVTVGQIRGPGNMALVQLIFTYELTSHSGKLSVKVSNAAGSDQKTFDLASHIPLNWKFNYVVELGIKQQLQVSMPGVTPIQIPIDPSWEGQELYFQAGNDVLGTASIDDGGIMSFYTLKAEHQD
jgi:hypothetical protein